MTFFSSLAWTGISFLLFTVLVAVISAWKTRDEQLDTAEGYFLAGRGLPGVVIAGSLLLTNLSAEQLVGLNGQSWKTNMGPIAWEVGSMFTLLVLAYYFLPKYLKMGAMTIPSLMEERYGKGTKTMFSLVIVVMYSILNLPVILYSGAVVFEQIFDISGILGTSKFMAVAILCLIIGIIGGCYAIFGGLKAVAVSDTINGIGLIIGGLMIPFLGFAALSAATGGHGIMDGIKYMVEADPAKMNAINAWNAPEPEVPWPLIITGMFFNNLYWWCTNQSFVQRSLAAKSLKEGQKGAIFCGFLKCLGPLYLVIPGVIAFYLPSIQDKLAAAGSSAIDFAYPALIAEIVPKPVMGFFAAVMFGAILSSFNSVLNSASTIYALDIHRPLFNPTASDARMVKIGQNFGTVVAVVSTIMSPFMLYMGGITSFVNSAFAAFNTPIFVCLLCGFFWKKVPAIAAKIVIPVHVVLYFILQFGLRNVIPFLQNIHYLYFTAILFVFDMLLMWVIVKKHPRASDFELKDVGAVDLTPWKNGKIWATVTLLIMVLAYIIFSPLGFGKSEKTTYQNYLENQTTASVSDSVQ
ncbi:MAG: solute:sodium symporter family transporter [Butyricicoccaceae bacterium]